MNPREEFPPEPKTAPRSKRCHDGDGEHFHDISVDARGAISEFIWKVDNVELTTVGIDIGSSTSHLMFSRVRLQRRTQLLSSQFIVVERKILWRSPIILTPFLPDDTIDAAGLGAFLEHSFHLAGLLPTDIDSGAVILTGEAIRKHNAQAIANLFAGESGKFVCASAGHHLECALAAHGSGAVALSRASSQVVLNVDIGGGTTKLALIRKGEIIGTCAFAVGGRLIAHDAEGRLVRIDSAAQIAGRLLGLELRLNERPDPAHLDRLVAALGAATISLIRQGPLCDLTKELLLTDRLPTSVMPDIVTFSGGVSEYIYGRECELFGDIAKALADNITAAFGAGGFAARVLDPGQGIRATVIGASQFAVQVSGKTIHISQGTPLPVRNVPVLFPRIVLDENFSAPSVATAIIAAFARTHLDTGESAALALRWRGDPDYPRLRNLAEGIVQAMASGANGAAPLILLVDGDIGKTLGLILEQELSLPRHLVSIDGIQLKELDYVDIGELIEPSKVVPIVIKSLLFSTGSDVGKPGKTGIRYRHSLH